MGNFINLAGTISLTTAAQGAREALIPPDGKPLAIDLFCGLFQAKFFSRTDASIKQLVARGAQYPNHVWLSVFRQSPRPVALKFRPVCDFENAAFTARLACFWHVWISALKPIESYVLVFALGFIGRPALFVFSSRPYLSQVTSSLNRAFVRTISLVAVRWRDAEMRAATSAIAAKISGAFPLSTPRSSGSSSTIAAAPFLIRSDCLEWLGTLPTKQIIHGGRLS